MSQALQAQLRPTSTSPLSSSDSEQGESSCSQSDISYLVQLQRNQRAQHDVFSHHQIDTTGAVMMDSGKYHRRARAYDVNFVLKLGLDNANEWAMQFDAYRNLSQTDKNMVLSEFGFAFILVDQAYKTAQRANDGYWMLQNDTFMHPNYFFSLPEEDAMKENAQKKAELHSVFVNELVKCVGEPFKKLQIDETECAILKTIMLLTPSFPKKVVYKDVEDLQNKFMAELMEHSARRCPDAGPQRFGEVVLLISSLRCGIKLIYNQTKVSDMFQLMTFDPCVRKIFLS